MANALYCAVTRIRLFPISQLQKSYFFYCYSQDPIRVHLALVSELNHWQTKAEIAVLKRLQGVQGIIQPLLQEFDRENYYSIVELCNQGGLYEFLNRKIDCLEAWQKGWICYSLANIVKDYHAANVLLRDLKTENVLISLSLDGIIETKLTGVGQSIHLPDASELEKCRPTLPEHFLPPEYFAQAALEQPFRSEDFSRDLWSLGAIFFEVFTGFRCPEPEAIEQFEKDRRIPAFPHLNEYHLNPFAAEIKDLLQHNPTERPPAAWIAKRMADSFSCTFPTAPVTKRVIMRPKINFNQVLKSLAFVKTKSGERMIDRIATYLAPG